MSLGATGEYFSEEDCAAKILPVVCPLLLDKEKIIRDSANRAIDTYLHKIRAAASDMPETALPPPQAAGAGGAAAPRMATPKSGESAGWTGWAISSFTNKLSTAAGDMQTNGSGATTPKPAPSPGLDSRKPQTASASTLHRQAVSSPPAESSRGTSPNPTAMAQEFLPEDDFDDGGDSWGDMGDMDENDDSSNRPSTSNDKATLPTSASATPFDDAEPDFASWLAERSGKKPGAKPLPKGLSKSTSSVVTKKTVAKKPAAKKIDLKPKEDDDDGGWGDGW